MGWRHKRKPVILPEQEDSLGKQFLSDMIALGLGVATGYLLAYVL